MSVRFPLPPNLVTIGRFLFFFAPIIFLAHQIVNSEYAVEMGIMDIEETQFV